MLYYEFFKFVSGQDYGKILAYTVGYIIVAAMYPFYIVYKLKNKRKPSYE